MSKKDFREGKVLGRGGFGTVYADLEDPRRVIKVSDKNSNCRRWSNEYEKIMDAVNKIKNNKFYKYLIDVNVLEPSAFYDSDEGKDGRCYMLSERVYRPKYAMCGREDNDNEDGPTLQAQFGQPEGRMIHKGRGDFIGVDNIEKYWRSCSQTNTKLELVVYQMGVLMALMHYVAKNDCFDIELFLGRRYRCRKYRLFLADFDMTKTYEKVDDEVIYRMAWSLSAVPYFPIPGMKYYKEFSKGYLAVARDQGVEAVAEQVLADM